MPYAAAFFLRTSLRVRSTEDEDSPKGYRSPKPATSSGGVGRKALFAGAGGRSRVFRQSEARLTAGFFMGNFKFFLLPRRPSNGIFLL